ncbi:MAG TPA: GNAT family N-acetyltransferase [Kofleriaceae bacterium]|jgi:GNAT superfamily N-acetyltransferase|nr:GNAT family N-acetyltransferase [Kofleriaceae bacterium]
MSAGDDDLRVEAFTGDAARRYLPAVAALRIEVFREWPYLYDGTLAYEERYLAGYAADDALIAIAFAGDRVVGAATAMPLVGHSDDVVPPLAAAGFDPATVCYFGESVLSAAYRGRGLGHRFFDEREAFARARGHRVAAFCAVARPDDHPARPAGYVPLDRFWTKRGFVRRPDIVGSMAWQDLGDAEETAKPMVFWVKPLGSA